MRVTVVYESMFGNTHTVAEKISTQLEDLGEVELHPTSKLEPSETAGTQLLVVGGPTHLHGMTSKSSRKSAVETADDDPTIDLDDDVGGPGLRDWIKQLPTGDGRFFAAFDTRADKPELLTGSAARGIARRLRHRGYRELLEHESFVLDGNGPIDQSELERAEAWGLALSKESKALNIL